MSELPYQVERAKSGKASCKVCKQKIENGALRLAVMVKSSFFDGKQPNWYHDECFFNKQHPQSINEIGNFNKLENEDQKKIKDLIGKSNAVVMPDEERKSKGKGKKRGSTDMPDENMSALKDFHVEYSKSGRATCRYCDIKICKDEIRVSKTVFDTEAGRKYGGQALWYHLKCFAENRMELLYFAGGDSLPGFDQLKKKDQDIVKNELKSIKADDIPIKKLKTEIKSDDELKAEQQIEKKLEEQNTLFQEYRTALRQITNFYLDELLRHNSQIPQGKSETVDRIADYMAFGLPEPCLECKEGQLVLDTSAYKCTGHTQWTKCTYTTQEPKRTPLKIPDELLKHTVFSNYKPKTDVRVFHAAPSTDVIVKVEPSTSVKKEIPIPPLKNLQFFMYGRLTNKEETKRHIIKLGGQVVSKLTDTTVAVISTKKDVENMPDKMKEVKEKDIGVVEESFLDSIDTEKGTIATSLQIVKENNIAEWGSDPATRLPQEVLGGKRIPKSDSKKNSPDSKLNLKIYGGTAVDPASKLQDEAQVYVNEAGLKYSVVLVKTDVVTQKNSFYKVQLLEHNDKTLWLFRSWGRIGTAAGGNKLVQVRLGHRAGECEFEKAYEQRTKNTWGIKCVKQPGCYYPIEVDYSDESLELQIDPDSDLPASVQQLVKKIFDIKMMKSTMKEFELDTEKMPLGKLTKNQIKSGYETLSELQKLIEDGKASQSQIVDATNKFFTLIPHNFGANNAPLLNNIEIIKNKTEMLDNLFEIEIAFKMLESDCNDSTSQIEECYKKLKADIAPLDDTTDEYMMISEYVDNTHAKTHSSYTLEIKQVFKVVRDGEEERYEPFRELHNRRLLWHGSRLTNFAGILSQGLRIAPPEAPVTGYMFGKGIYFADMVSKSAKYCATSRTKTVGFLLLCEVALGDMKICHGAENVKLGAGTHSAWGVGRTQPDPARARRLPGDVLVPLGPPVLNPDAKGNLLHNEFIVYDVAQVKVKYLVQMKFNYKY